MNQPVLTKEQISEFHERGYLIADFGLDHALLDKIVERVHPLYGEDYHRDNSLPVRVQDAWKQVEEVRLLARNANIATALQQLLGRAPLPFQTLNFPVGTRQLPHSDTVHFNSVPSGFMAGVWVALENIDGENGPLIYYPGSHKLPEYSMQDFGLEPGHENYNHYEQRIQKLIRENKLEPAYGTIRKGEALIWHANLLHGGAPQNDLTRSRHSQVTHYYFEGCRYYTPMYSSPEKKHYRRPYWIPDSANFVLPDNKPKLKGLLQRIKHYLSPRR